MSPNPERLDRILDLDPVSGLLRLQPEVSWSRVQEYLGTTAWEAPLVAWDGRVATVLELAAGRAPASPFLPLAEPADWVRDLRLRTPQGAEVGSPFAPRRATGPELRFPALAFGPAYATPIQLSLLCLPRAPLVALTARLESVKQGVAILRRVATELDHLSLAAQALALPSGCTLHAALRRTGEVALPAWLSELPSGAEPEPTPDGAPLLLRHAWGPASGAWAARLGKALSTGKLAAAHLAPVGPHGLRVALWGVESPARARSLGLLDAEAARRVATALALRKGLLTGPGGRP